MSLVWTLIFEVIFAFGFGIVLGEKHVLIKGTYEYRSMCLMYGNLRYLYVA